MLRFQLIQIIFWLALSIWFGAVLFLAVAWPIIFRTIREQNPVLTSVLSVNLEGQHATLLAGSVVANLQSRLSLIQLVCAGVVLIISVLHFFVADMRSMNLTAAWIRCLLALAAGVVVAYDRFVLWPRVMNNRKQYLDHADEPEVANPALDRFHADQRQSELLMKITTALVLCLIMYSANIQPAPLAPPTDQSSAPSN